MTGCGLVLEGETGGPRLKGGHALVGDGLGAGPVTGCRSAEMALAPQSPPGEVGVLGGSFWQPIHWPPTPGTGVCPLLPLSLAYTFCILRLSCPQPTPSSPRLPTPSRMGHCSGGCPQPLT